MKPSESVAAITPTINATVSASAGSGKTWLLVTRIIRLLLNGAEPGHILALTFTRKAAAEMLIRLNERLLEMTLASEETLKEHLNQVGIQHTPEVASQARNLFETCLHTPYPIRILTFHSFCQDILSQFALEADIPPGFDLIEKTALLEQQAWETLFKETTQNKNGALTTDINVLMQATSSPENLKNALNDFLDHRSDWWAYTENQNQPAEYARSQLEQKLGVNEQDAVYEQFFSGQCTKELERFTELLLLHPTKTNQLHAENIQRALAYPALNEEAFDLIKDAFLTKENKPRARNESATQAKKMGDVGQQQFIQLHHDFCERIDKTSDHIKRINTLRLNSAWYRSGDFLVNLYQNLKRQQRLLDFNDLEWKCYQLLRQSDNALWIQYKIDRSIDHILIDEFQDTNPTQWNLLLPLLQEMASGESERQRSVFLVGDQKQSIYGFRRANPELQAQASEWLRVNLNAQATPLTNSRRSSKAIINLVNSVFSQPAATKAMSGFERHDTHLNQLFGEVTCYNLCQQEENEEDIASQSKKLRNPLIAPRPEKNETVFDIEAQLITSIISSCVGKVSVSKNNQTRLAEHGDIMVLFRSRRNLKAYEKQLLEKRIPFISDQQGSFLDNIEIRDIECLINTLITPYNDMALVQVLRSPVFSISNEDLILLKPESNRTTWFQQLMMTGFKLAENHALNRAARLLQSWAQLADVIPVHDLLDRIYSESGLINRYIAATPESRKQQVKANLLLLLDISLELDSGRYPSLSHFLHYLKSLRNAGTSPDEASHGNTLSRVKLMTIHASKGLESPIVILADSNMTPKSSRSNTTIVDWPSSKEKPEILLFHSKKEHMDSFSAEILKKNQEKEATENMNLLYVALTRARQYLHITGTARDKSSETFTWYELVKQAFMEIAHEEMLTHLVHREGSSAIVDTHVKSAQLQDTQLNDIPAVDFEHSYSGFISPSLNYEPEQFNSAELSSADAQSRGILIHKAIDLLTNRQPVDVAMLKSHTEIRQLARHDKSSEWLDEAISLVQLPDLQSIFSPGNKDLIFNELPVIYQNGERVYGIIDRVIIRQDCILLIDYKTHSYATKQNCELLARQYKKQLGYYQNAAKSLWPGKAVYYGVIFTACAGMVWFNSPSE